ncbi:MAG TPA: hypothetical protein PKD91_13985, partial [Bacteroidia bacterium]|nr:hypothetical protein [Bacteroidia bacterium]
DKYFINDNITISGSDELILEGCQIVVLPNDPPWQITIETNAKLTIVPYIGSVSSENIQTQMYGCEKMWAGIKNNGGTLDMFNMPGGGATPFSFPTIIEDAINAIESDGGSVQIRFVNLDKNFRSFYFYEDDDVFVGTPFVKGCKITNSDGVLRKEPKLGIIPYEHMLLENITNVVFVIGDDSPSGLRNTFDAAVYGIRSFNSSINFKNNLFQNMNRNDDQYYHRNDGTAIFASSATGNIINITSDNEFKNSPFGIALFGNIESNIQGNEFNNLIRGININNNASNVSINEYNTFTSVSTAVIGRNITGNFQVYENTFNNTIPASITSMPYTNFNSTAVTIQNSGIFTIGDVNVFSNTINNYRIGIHALNIPKIKIGTPYKDIDTSPSSTIPPRPNTITHTTLVANQFNESIWLQNCPEAELNDNVIENTDNTTSATYFGVELDLVTDGYLRRNLINGTSSIAGSALLIRNPCDNTVLECNEMDGFDIGIQLADGDLPTQGEADP